MVTSIAAAQTPKQPPKQPPSAKPKDPPIIEIGNPLALDGKLRGVQLLYFLERANEELERATLERRSFIPHVVRSIDEEQL
jgi:hypothetical protein